MREDEPEYEAVYRVMCWGLGELAERIYKKLTIRAGDMVSLNDYFFAENNSNFQQNLEQGVKYEVVEVMKNRTSIKLRRPCGETTDYISVVFLDI